MRRRSLPAVESLYLLEVAEKGGFIRKPKVGWYEPVDPATGEVLSDKLMRAKEIVNNGEFWNMMFNKTELANYIKMQYTMGTRSLMNEDEQVVETVDEEVFEE